ncbi:MAG: WecB/TagA/CpsF family glycosyltransferase [Deltaproteobacteria bacterium]|nr:WecB/TagA/CpsF family glycosyltransferase [Deltaproteobacteria bacterium]
MARVQVLLAQGSGGYYIALNPEKIMHAIASQDVCQLLLQAHFVYADGIGVAIASKLLQQKNIERVTGADLLLDVAALCEKEKKTIALYGASKDNIAKALQALQVAYPKLNIAFAVDGYQNDSGYITQLMQSTPPDLVFVGLGSPKQEQWIIEQVNRFPQTLFTGVGGSFDVLSGAVTRAPQWIRRIGMEWLYRIVSQPLQRYKRIKPLMLYGVRVLKERWKR